MKPQKSEYDIQAGTFAEKHNLTMTATYLGHFTRLSEHATSQWQVTLARPGKKPFTFKFSQSIHNSWRYHSTERFTKPIQGLPQKLSQKSWPTTGQPFNAWRYTCTPCQIAPTLYSVLACLTKSDPGDIEDFCADYGYNADSIKDNELHKEVRKEWKEINHLFGDCLEELQEIC